MESIKRYWFWGILISILSIFAMSHNASAAVRLNLNGDLYYERGYYAHSTPTSGTLNIVPNSSTNGFSSNTFSLENYDYFYLGFTSNSLPANFDEDNYTNYTFRTTVITSSIPVISSSQANYIISSSINEVKCSSLNLYIPSIQLGNETAYTNGLPQNYMTWSTNGARYYATSCYNIEIYGKTGGYNNNYPKGIFHLGQKNSRFKRVFSYYDNDLTLRYGTLIIAPEIIFYENDSEAVSEKEKQETQQAVDESAAAGGSSSSSAQTGTTGLLNAITGAVNVIATASPTNCRINGNMGNLNMGQIDLCANPVPTFIQTIGSLLLILMCVPLAISLFNRFIAIFRSFQS